MAAMQHTQAPGRGVATHPSSIGQAPIVLWPAPAPAPSHTQTSRRQKRALQTLCQASSRPDARVVTLAPVTPQPQLLGAEQSEAFVRVAELASAWSKVARRLPEQRQGAEDVGCIIRGIRLAMVALEGLPPRRDGRDRFSRAVFLAVTLAELSAVGLPLDAEGIAAAVVADAVGQEPWLQRSLDHETVRQKMGDTIASLVHDILLVRAAPQRVELYDDTASSAIREWCIAAHDVRACVVEVVSRWDELQHRAYLPLYEQQQMAIEALQVYAPLGHALGMGAVSAAMEDACFQVLFPESYASTSHWLHTVVDPAEDALYAAQQQLLLALESTEAFTQRAAGCVLRARTKSLFSMMKKLLRLGDMAKGGRRPEEIFDLLGLRAVVQPRTDLPPDEAERLAVEACYIVKDVAEQLWRSIPSRTKDYIQRPKGNGYRCLHMTICMHSVMAATGITQPATDPRSPTTSQAPHTAVQAAGTSKAGSTGTGIAQNCGADAAAIAASGSAPYLELQIRTQSMDDRAERGDAAHTAYKGGLDARQARQLQAWSQELHTRLALQPQRKLSLPPSITGTYTDTSYDSIDYEAEIRQIYNTTTTIDQSTNTTTIDAAVIDTTSVSVEPNQGATQASNTALTSDGADSASSGGASASDTGDSGYGVSTEGGAGVFQGDRSTGAAGADASTKGQGLYKSTRSRAVLAAEELFKLFDANGDGRVSLSELREQLWEVETDWAAAGGTAAWDAAAQPTIFPGPAPSGASMPGEQGTAGVGVGQQGEQGEWQEGGNRVTLNESQLERLQRALAGDYEVEMSLEEFAVFLKQAEALRKTRARQQSALYDMESQEQYN